MIRQIAPQFFSVDLPRTLAYYKDKLGFECLGTWQDPPVYAIVARDLRAIHFRCAEPPTPNPDKYADDLPLKPAAGVTSPHGCPRFAPAYVGRKRWAKPFDRLLSKTYSLISTRHLERTENTAGYTSCILSRKA
jgi:hypothetical protein